MHRRARNGQPALSRRALFFADRQKGRPVCSHPHDSASAIWSGALFVQTDANTMYSCRALSCDLFDVSVAVRLGGAIGHTPTQQAKATV